MTHLHWPVPVESLLGEVVAYICDECYDACEPELGQIEREGEVWKAFFPSEAWAEHLLIRNRAGNTLRMIMGDG